MNILGIDYGKNKVGLALAEGPLAYPYAAIKYKSESELLTRLEAIIKKEFINKIVVGISEGKSAESQQKFSGFLTEKFNIEVVLQDETLSTSDAQILSRESGMKRIKRKSLEDAFAATIILQSYLDQTSEE